MVALQYLFDNVAYLVIAADTNNSVSLGDLGSNFVLVALCKTSCNDYLLDASLFFKLRKFKYSLNSFLLCRLDKSAGIYDSHISQSSVAHQLIALFIYLV